MDLEKVKKISYIATSLLLIAVLLLNVSLTSVRASEISSLPADAGVEVRYDSDNIYLTYNGESFTISRSILLNNSVPTQYSYPMSWARTNEVDHFGFLIPCSYWFSPSDMSVYIMTSSRFALNSNYTGMYGIDYSYIVRSFSGGSFYITAGNTGYSNQTRVNVYKLSLSDMSCEFYSNIKDVDGASSIIASGYPDDLVCLLSNYEISGFFEFKAADTCYTPDYYFDYQYLYYTEDVGYTFVDSALPLVSITNPDPTQALLTFSDLCNKHVYTSVDGIDWFEQYSVSGMYSNNASVNYKWFYDSVGGTAVYKLVYTNDESFGEEPILTPEYGTINDVVSDLWSIVYHNDSLIDTGINHGVQNDLNALPVEWLLVSMFTQDYLYLDQIRGPDGGWYEYSGETFLYLVKQMFYEMQNIRTVLNDEVDELTDVVHNDLKSVFDNITNTNLYLDKLIGTVKDIDIPDYNYNEKLNDIKQLLFSIDSHITSGGSSSGSTSDSLTGFVPFDDSNIINQLTDINTELDAIKDVSIADTLVGITGMLTQLTDINTDLDAIKATTLADSVTDVFDDFGDDFIDDFGEVIDFVDGAVSGVSGSADGDIAIPVLENTLSFDSQVVSGTVFINTLVMKFWDVMGPMQTVTLLGASFFVLHMVIRKGMF